MSNRAGYNIENQYATYFVTFTVVGWIDLFTRKELKEIIVDSLVYCQKNKGLIINAYVIMSSHLHLVISAEENSDGLSSIVRDFKKYTSKAVIKFTQKSKTESRRDWLDIVFKYHAKFNKNNKTYKVWQDSNQPKILVHPRFTSQKVNYIHQNPVVAGIVKRAEDYVYSSAGVYAGQNEEKLDISIIDFGVEKGYVFT